MKKLSVFTFLLIIFFAGQTYASTIDLNLSSSTFTATGAETITIHNIVGTVDGQQLQGEYWIEFTWDPVNFVFVPVAAGLESQAPVDPVLEKSQWLLGKWHFTFTILSTFDRYYTLSSVDMTQKDSEGGYFVDGTDQYGNPVVAAYYPQSGNWSLLDPGTVIDEFYYFYTDGSSILPNSYYYQVDPSTLQIISNGYPLSGYKYSTSTQSIKSTRNIESQTFSETKMIEEAMPGTGSPEANAAYRELKAYLNH